MSDTVLAACGAGSKQGSALCCVAPSPPPGWEVYQTRSHNDAWNRLVEVKDNTTVVQTNRYDGLNRRIIRDDSGGSGDTRHFFYNQQWQCLVEATESGGTTTSSYAYNAQGVRVQQTVDDGSTTTTHDYLIDAQNPTGYAQVVLEAIDGVAAQTFTLGHDVLAQASSAQVLQLLADGHGSTRAVWDQTAAQLAQRYAYDANGQMLDLPGYALADAAVVSLLYSGEQTDPSGRQYLRARYYDPATGRFNRLDPFAGNLSDPQSLHKYLYAHADPVQFTDPSGLFGIAGFVAGFSIQNSLRNLKIEADLLAFDLANSLIGGIQAGQGALEIYLSFAGNQALGFGVGTLIGAATRWTSVLLDRGFSLNDIRRLGGSSQSSNLRNVRNVQSGLLQQSGNSCGLYCAGEVLNHVQPNRAATALEAAYGGEVAYMILQRESGGLSTIQLQTMLSNNLDSHGVLLQRGVRSDALEGLLSRGSVIAHVDGNHFVVPLGTFDDGGTRWVRVYDPAVGYYEQALDSFMTRTGANNQMISIVGGG